MTRITLIKPSGEAITENIDDIGQLKEYMYHNNSWIVKDDTYYDINDDIPDNLIAEDVSLTIVKKSPSPKKIANDIIYNNPHLTEEQKNIIRRRLLPGDEEKDLETINVLDLNGLGKTFA
jgi:hypothetical protein